MAETQQDDVKGKVQSVREIVPGKSNNEIVLVLQYYDNNVETTIQAYLEDGAKEALTQWQFSGNKANNKKKRKNKQKEANQQALEKAVDQSEKSNQDAQHIEKVSLATTQLLVNGNGAHSNGHLTEEKGATTYPSISVPVAKSSEIQLAQKPLPQRQSHQHNHSTTSGSHVRERTISEQSAASASSTSQKNKKPHAGMEKSVKDLHRQTLSIDRYKRVLNEEVEKGHKRIKTVFEEMVQTLKRREAALLAEMDAVKSQAVEVFQARQSQAVDLKLRVDRSPNLSESEMTELRSEIKHFVADRKIDEDLGKTTRFLYDSDHLQGEIQKFGEVVPVRCAYSKRRPSVSSVVSQSSESAVTMETNHSLATGRETTSSVTAVSSRPSTTTTTVTSSSSPEIIDAQTRQEMAQIQRRLQESLKLQGLTINSPPRQGRQPPASGQHRSGPSGQRGGSGDNERSRQGGQRSSPQQRSTDNGPSGPGGDDARKSRNAKRRQKLRERQRDERSSATTTENKATHNHNSKPSPGKQSPHISGPPAKVAHNNINAQLNNHTSSGSHGTQKEDKPHDTKVNNNNNAVKKQDDRKPQRLTRRNNPKTEATSEAKESNAVVKSNSATVSINGGKSPTEMTPKRAEVIVNGDIHKD